MAKSLELCLSRNSTVCVRNLGLPLIGKFFSRDGCKIQPEKTKKGAMESKQIINCFVQEYIFLPIV